MDQVLGGPYTDLTLRGPTSATWLEPWRKYLNETLDVCFVRGELLSVTDVKGDPQAKVSHSVDHRDHAACDHDERLVFVMELDGELLDGVALQALRKELRVDESTSPEKVTNASVQYVVMALDPVSAERVTASWRSRGVPSGFEGFRLGVEVAACKLERFNLVAVFDAPTSRERADRLLRATLARVEAAKLDADADPTERSAFRALSHATGSVTAAMPDGTVAEYTITLWFQRRVGPDELRRIEDAVGRSIEPDQHVRLMSVTPEVGGKPTTVSTPRLPPEKFGADSNDRFQTFTGAQFYFEQDFKLVRGHVYFPDTDLGSLGGLASRSSSRWHEPTPMPPRTRPRSLNRTWRHALPTGIRGVLSVDIGDSRKVSSHERQSLLDSSARGGSSTRCGGRSKTRSAPRAAPIRS
ncbi:MAG: hypothetical protein U0326_43945 [Polyangiales bacterium]